MSIGVCRVSRHSPPPPCAPSHSSEATTAGGGTLRPPPRHDDCATGGRTVKCRACSSRPSAPRGIGCGHVGISRSGRDVHVPVDTVLWGPSGRHFRSRLPVAQRDRSHITPHDAPKSLLCLTGFQTGSANSSGRSLEHDARRRGARDGRDRARVHLQGGIARRSCPCGQSATAKMRCDD